MLNRTIAKISLFVIFVLLIATGCNHLSSNGQSRASFDREKSPFEAPIMTGKLESNDIKESSGLAASKCQPDVFWTHNDSGDGAFIFAINSKGQHLGTWKVANASNVDWEDIAGFKNPAGECFIYIGEIGNNELKRDSGGVYRVREPQVTTEARDSSKKDPRETEPAEQLRFSYSDSPRNAETMIVHPVSGDIYVLTKSTSTPSGVYKIKTIFGQTLKAEKIADLSVPAVPNGFLTGGSISPDGKHVVVCDYSAAYELSLPTGAGFDEIWKQQPVRFDIGNLEQGEAISYSLDGSSVFATSEKKNSAMFEARRKK